MKNYYTQKLSEIDDLFDGELKLVSKSSKILQNTPDIIVLGRHTVESELDNSCGAELIYQTEQNSDMLAIYIAVLYRINEAGRS